MVNIAEGNNELNVRLVPIPPVGPKIAAATWKTTYNTYGGYYGQLVKVKITVDSPVAFTGKLKVSLPGEIAGTDLENYDQMLQRAPTTIAQVDPEGEFYIGMSYSTRLKALVYGHYSRLMEARDSVTHTVSFPAGTSTFDTAFFLRPDYFRYSYSRGELKWVDKPYYLPTLHSPKVELYDGADNLLDSAEYRYAIEVKPVDEYPVSVNIPRSILSGGEAWAGFTIFLPYKRDCLYRITLYVKEPNPWNLAFGQVVDINWYYEKDRWYLGGAEPISADGQFTFRGLLDRQEGKYVRVPAKAIYKPSRLRPYEPVPPGIYKVFMKCDLSFISYASDTATKYYAGGPRWSGVEVGEIEVV